MNKEELTDVLIRIQAIIRDSFQIEKTQIRHIDDLVEWALAQEENDFPVKEDDFPVDEQKLKDFLEYFENIEYRNTAVHYISGGFAHSEYEGWNEDEDDEDEQELYIALQWGVLSDVENRVNTEHYTISIRDFNNAKTNEEIYKLLDN
jgi:hypothetical protein